MHDTWRPRVNGTDGEGVSVQQVCNNERGFCNGTRMSGCECKNS